MATATWTVEPYFERSIKQEDPNDDNGEQNVWVALLNFIGEDKALWWRALTEYDLSAFPGASDGSDVISASLTIYDQAGGRPGYDMNFRRCTQPGLAVPGQTSWLEYSAGNAWSTAGGSPTAVDMVVFDSSIIGLYTVPGFGPLVIDALADREGILSLIARWGNEADDGWDRDFIIRSTTHTTGPAPVLEITYGVPDPEPDPAQPTGHRDIIPPRNAHQPSRPSAPRRPRAGRRARQPRS